MLSQVELDRLQLDIVLLAEGIVTNIVGKCVVMKDCLCPSTRDIMLLDVFFASRHQYICQLICCSPAQISANSTWGYLFILICAPWSLSSNNFNGFTCAGRIELV